MKKIILVAIASITFAACSSTDPKCIAFNEDNYDEQSEKAGEGDLFTEAEQAMLSMYFMQYAIVHEDADGNPFLEAMQESAKEEGFKDHSNMCEVLDDMRQQIKEDGMTEEEFLENVSGMFTE